MDSITKDRDLELTLEDAPARPKPLEDQIIQLISYIADVLKLKPLHIRELDFLERAIELRRELSLLEDAMSELREEFDERVYS
jgi:hypothetical protein